MREREDNERRKKRNVILRKKGKNQGAVETMEFDARD